MNKITTYYEVFYPQGEHIRCVIYGGNAKNTSISKFFSKLSKYERRILLTIINQIDSSFPLTTKVRRFKKLRDNVWELKDNSSKIRIGCFWYNTTLVCIYGFRKKDDKWREKDIQNVLNAYSECQDICFY